MPRQSQNGMADREPCPWRIVDDVGGAFCMGAIGGTVWHSVRGGWIAPKGARMRGSLSAVQARSPVLGGQFAVWGGLFACCDCTLTAVRQKEDPWNSIISGATTGGILAARAGPRAMASAAVVGGVLLALIEGMGIMFTKAMAPPVPTKEDYERAAHQDATAPPVQASNPFAGMGAPPPSNSAPPSSSSSDDLTDMNSGTTFSTEGGSSSSGDTGSSGSGGSWFSFG